MQNNNRWSIARKIFLNNFIAAVLGEITQVGAGLIDGIIVSRMLSNEAMASFGVSKPIFSLLAIFSALFATGMQTMTSHELGRGNIKECNRIFCSTLYLSGAFSVLTMTVVLFTSPVIAVFFGAAGNGAALNADAAAYIRGLAWGAPSLFLTAVLDPAIMMDSGRKRVLRAAVVEAVCDILFDILAIHIGSGLFGIGLATSLARYIRLVILLLHFREKSRWLRFVRLKTSLREMLHMFSLGTEKACRRVGNTIQPALVNSLILFSGGTMAMTAMSVRANISNLTEVFGVGLADTVGLMTGVYYGERNVEAQHILGKLVHRACTIFCGATGIILVIFARPIAGFYTHSADQVTQLTWIALIGIALQCPMQALVRSRISYLQRIGHNKKMWSMIAVSTVAYPVICAFVLGRFFGAYGVLLCYTFGDLLTLITVWGFYAVKSHSPKPTPEEYMDLPSDFYVSPGDVISLDIRDLEDVSLVSRQISLFCHGHKLDDSVGRHAALCFEEIAVNIIKHGFPLNKAKAPIIDLRVVISDDRLIVRMQDNCPKFDLGAHMARLATAERDEQLSNMGTWISLNLADDIRYVYSFETNIIFMEFNITPTPDGVDSVSGDGSVDNHLEA